MKRKKAKQWSDAAKAKVVEYSLTHTMTETALEFGCCKGSVSAWVKAAGVEREVDRKAQTEAATEASQESVKLKRAELRLKMLQRADEMLDRMGEKYTVFVGKDNSPFEIDRPPAGVCKDLALTLAILVDKLRLESGETTGRTSSDLNVTVTDEDRRTAEERVRDAILEEAERITAGAGD